MISTASRVGTGNIAGIATAIATGGPGAVFWMGLMAIVNIIAMFFLGKVALKVLKDYERQKKEGKKPIFYEDEVGLTGTVWTRNRK